MRGFMCSTTAKTNEEYRRVIKNRMRIMLMVSVIGLVTLIIGLLSMSYLDINISDRMKCVYMGVGTGLFIAGVIMWIKNRLLLSNEEKLKESRLSNSDERIQEITNKAFRIAGITILIALYAVGLIGGIFYPILIKVLLLMLCIFILTFVFAYKYYNNKM